MAGQRRRNHTPQRADGSTITAGVPEPIHPPEELDGTGEIPVVALEPPVIGPHVPQG